MTSMQQIDIIAKRARAAGMSYGQYIAQNPNVMPRPVDMSEYKICKTCGEPFLPPLKKDGQRSANAANCQSCIAKRKAGGK